MTTETVFRTCPTCEASCGLAVEVDRAKNRVISIKGDPQHVRSRGYVCAKSQAFNYIYEDPERLRRPVKRVGDQWQEVSWNEALDDIGARLAAIRADHGKDAIAMYYGNPNGHNFHSQIYTELFINMLNTERFFSAGSVDQQPQNLVCDHLFGNAWAFPVPDLARTDFFVCMGGNPVVSQGSLLGAPDAAGSISAISQRGGKTVVIDPRRTETAVIADQHIFVRPGTDALLLFAWINELFATDTVQLGRLAEFTRGVDQVRAMAQPFTPESVAAATGVAPEVLRQLVAEFSAAERSALYSRIGLCTQEFGTLSSWLVYVINILCGRLDTPGGMMFARPATGQNEPTGQLNVVRYGRFKSRARGFPEYMGMLPASFMAEELECTGQDAVHAMITVAGNPVLSVPNGKRIAAALEKLDFVVALDFYINETTCHADYILPSTSQLEHSNYDFLFSAFAQRNFASYSPQVLASDADSKEQYQLLLELVARMNGMTADELNSLMFEGMLGHVLASPALAGIDAATIKAKTAAYQDGERLLDILLRVGPYGDKFDDDNDGLNLARLKQAPHGIDFGALEPRLPHILRTESQMIQLVPEVIAADVPRLEELLQRAVPEFLLIGRRNIRDMNSWLHNIKQYVRGKNRCSLIMHSQDAERLGLQQGGMAQLGGKPGQLQVEVEISDDIMPGVVSLPHGFGHRYGGTRQTVASSQLPGVSANDLIDDEGLDIPSGTSIVNGVPVSVVRI